MCLSVRIAGFFAMLLLAPSAMAETLRLDATNGAPIIDVTINGKAARLLVDGRLDNLSALNPAAVERLGISAIPVVRATAGLDEASLVRGKLSRPEMTFANGEKKRQIAGQFGLPLTDRADGVIGIAALPYAEIIIVLREGPPGAAARVMPLKSADQVRWLEEVGDVEAMTMFDFDQSHSFLSRPLAKRLAAASALTPRGEVVARPFLLGFDVMVQPVTVNFETTERNFNIRQSMAHTDAPITVPAGSDVIIVQAPAKQPKRPPLAVLGRDALTGCSDVTYNRTAKTLTAHCDN